jgi:hypothetical protein
MSVNLGRGPHRRKVWEPLFCVNKWKMKEEGYKKKNKIKMKN